MSRRLRPLAREEGFALVMAVIVAGLMMMLGLAAFAYVDAQQRESGSQRVKESAFNLGEGVLGAQTFLVASKWPDAPAGAFPRHCASSGIATADAPRCPDPAQIGASYASADYAAQSTWVVTVRDNGADLPETAKIERSSLSYYDPADDDDLTVGDSDDNVTDAADDADDLATDAQPSWDRNDDGRVWVRSQAVVRGRKRTLVALLNVQELAEAFPRNVLTAGRLTTGGNPHTMVRTLGSPVAIRNLAGSSWQASQFDVPSAVQQLTDGNKALSDRALDRLRQRAIAAGTYYPSGCPASLAGQIVFVEDGGADLCMYTGNDVWNCPASGVLVFARGGLYLGGNVEFCGVVYLANRSDPPRTDVLFNLQGNALMTGAVAVDGPGTVDIGSNADNLRYDANASGAVKTYPSGSIVPSTWREIPGQ